MGRVGRTTLVAAGGALAVRLLDPALGWVRTTFLLPEIFLPLARGLLAAVVLAGVVVVWVGAAGDR